VIVGTGSRVEIWNSDAWEAYSDVLTDDMISEAAREVGLA
jgi:DNA-binding transcriptional regulator/RsmH inhibitor MraZ